MPGRTRWLRVVDTGARGDEPGTTRVGVLVPWAGAPSDALRMVFVDARAGDLADAPAELACAATPGSLSLGPARCTAPAGHAGLHCWGLP